MLKSDYTKEEIEHYKKTFDRTKEDYYYWGTFINNETVYIPMKELKFAHLRNIITWVEDHPRHYTEATIIYLKAEYQRRYDLATPAEKVLFA